jgi:hypothetical protein
MYELYTVTRDEKEQPVSRLVDTFLEMEDAVKEAHVLMARDAVATKINPKQFPITSH